jgi:hypothetical protein
MLHQAIEKIDRELSSAKGTNTSNFVKAVKDGVASALKEFARQNTTFAQAVVQSDRTVIDCCEDVVKGAQYSLSDIEAYRRAVKFYFPGATVKFSMSIELVDKPSQDAVILDLANFF